MRFLITGANGFVGYHIIHRALLENHEVIALKRKKSDSFTFSNHNNLVWKNFNYENFDELKNEKIDVIIHLAATGISPRQDSWENLIKTNIELTIKICHFAKKINKRLICAGSYAEYGLSGLKYDFIPVDAPLEPTFPYAISKAIASQLAISFSKTEKIELAYLRIFNAFGPRQYEKNLWPSLYKASINKEDFKMTQGDQIRDFINIEEVAKLFIYIAEIPSKSFVNPFVRNIASGIPQSIFEFSCFHWKKWNSKGKLLRGAIPYRTNEVMMYVPEIDHNLLKSLGK